MPIDLTAGITTELMGEQLLLLPSKVIYVPNRKYLLISDAHFGKVDHFRKNGIGLPRNAGDNDFKILSGLIERLQPEKVIFLGDLFHSDYNLAWEKFKETIGKYRDVEFVLVLGNHDIMSSDQYAELTLCHQYEIGDILCTHEPLDEVVEGKYNLCGHIHPGVRLKGAAYQRLRLPCFYFGELNGIMPAFGDFTGLYVITPTKKDRVYVVHPDGVVQVGP